MNLPKRGRLRDPCVSSHPGSPIKVIDLIHNLQQGSTRPRLWQGASGVLVKAIQSFEGSTRHVFTTRKPSTRKSSRKIPSTTGLLPETSSSRGGVNRSMVVGERDLLWRADTTITSFLRHFAWSRPGDSEARVACALHDGPPREEAGRFASLTAIPRRRPDDVVCPQHHLDYLHPKSHRTRGIRA